MADTLAAAAAAASKVKKIKVVRAYIESLGEFKDIQVSDLDTVYDFKLRCLNEYVRPEDLPYFKIISQQVAVNWNGKIKREIDDCSNLLEIIANEEMSGSGGSMGKIVLILRNTSPFTKVRIPPSALMNFNSSSNNNNNIIINNINNSNYNNGNSNGAGSKISQNDLYEVSPLLGSNPWPVNVFGCTEWLYGAQAISSYSLHQPNSHLMFETFNDSLFRVLCDMSCKQGVLERLNHGNDKIGYYILERKNLWVYRSIGSDKHFLTSINNISPSVLKSAGQASNSFTLKFTSGKLEEELELSAREGNFQADWVSQIANIGSRHYLLDSDEQVNNKMCMVDQMISNFEQQKSGVVLRSFPKLRNILCILSNNMLRQKFISMGSKYVRYLQFWETAEDFSNRIINNFKMTPSPSRSEVTLRSDEVSRFIAIRRTFLEPTSDLYLDRCSGEKCAGIVSIDVSKPVDPYLFLPLQFEAIQVLIPTLSILISENMNNIKLFASEGESSFSLEDSQNSSSPQKSSSAESDGSASAMSPSSSSSLSSGVASGGSFWNRITKKTSISNTNSPNVADSSKNIYNSPQSFARRSLMPMSAIFKDWSAPSLIKSHAPQSWWAQEMKNLSSSHDNSNHNHINDSNESYKDSSSSSSSSSNVHDNGSSCMLSADNQDIICLPTDAQSIMAWIFDNDNDTKGNKSRSGGGDDLRQSVGGSEIGRDSNIFRQASFDNEVDDAGFSSMFGLGNIIKVGNCHAKYARPGRLDRGFFGETTGQGNEGTIFFEDDSPETEKKLERERKGVLSEIEKQRSPSEDFVYPSVREANTYDKYRYATAVLSTNMLKESRIILIVNNMITVIIHLKNVCKLLFDVKDPRSFILEDIYGVTWKFIPEGIDNVDALEQCKSWHQVICDLIPQTAVREYIECSGYFSKRGRINTSYKKRWFLLMFDTDNNWSLRYYKTKENPIFKGETSMRSIVKVECDFKLTPNYNRDHPPTEAKNTSFFTAFGIGKSPEYKINMISENRIWDLMSDSQPVAEYWYHLFDKVVQYNATTVPLPLSRMNSYRNSISLQDEPGFDIDPEDEDEAD